MRLQIRKLRRMNKAAAARKGGLFSQKSSTSSEGGGGWRNKYCFIAPADYPESQRDDIGPPHVWQGFKEKTTAHGLPHIDQSKGIVKRGFWSLITAVMLGGLIFNLIKISTEYAQHPVDVTIQLLHQSELIFPAVTICNMSPVRRSALEAAGGGSTATGGTSSGARRRKRSITTCDAGWQEFNGNCYFVSTSAGSFGDAEWNCQNEAAELASLMDAAEQTFVTSISYDVTSSDYWVGIQKVSGTWQWSDGGTMTYTNWDSDLAEPNGSGNCARLSNAGKWRDWICGAKYKFVCKKPVTTVTTTPEPPTTTTPTTVPETTPTTEPDTTVITTTPTTEPDTTTTLPETTTTTTEVPTTTTTTTEATTSTEAPSTEQTSEPSTTADDTAVPQSCCCTCCFTGPYLGTSNSCSSCAAPSVSDAAMCATNHTPPVTTTTPAPTTTTTTTTTTTAKPSTTTTEVPPTPKPLNGSQFPERVEVREDFKEEEQFTEALADIPVENKTSLGYSADDLILDCQYSGFQCFPSLFSSFYSAVHGNCFVFNSGWNESVRLLRSTKVGRRYGLHLIVNIDQDEYVKEVGDTAGIRLVVHPQNRMPFPEDEGITVSPGHSTSIGLRQVQIGREPHPFGNCTDPTIKNVSRNVYEELYNVQYSTTGCQRTCLQRSVIETCGCGDPYLPMHGKAFGSVKVKACDSSNMTQDDCRYKVTKLYNEQELHCDCPDSCLDTMFSLEVSIGQWPSNIQKDDIFEKLAAKIGPYIYEPEYHYEDNLIKLEVYYEEFNFEQIDERPAYTAWNFMSDIGGVLGLWIGFSLLTVFEFIELGSDLLVWFIARTCAKRKPQTDPVENIDIPPESSSRPPPLNAGKPERAAPKPFLPPYFLSEDPSAPSPIGSEVDPDAIEMTTATPPPPYTSRASSRMKSSTSVRNGSGRQSSGRQGSSGSRRRLASVSSRKSAGRPGSSGSSIQRQPSSSAFRAVSPPGSVLDNKDMERDNSDLLLVIA